MSYFSVSEFYKQHFGSKVYKIALNAGCTCPTRDGTLGTKGCIFCSANGSGDFVPQKEISIENQLMQAKKLIQSKMPSSKIKDGEKSICNNKYIAYFQNFTNTYGNINSIKEKWEKAINDSEVVGLAIGTRPDCLSDEWLKLLASFCNRTFVQVELGFQTSNENTADYIRRGFTNEVYSSAVQRLHLADKRIHVVTHIIFGLPKENKENMLDSVRYAIVSGTDGIKIMNLYILKGTDIAEEYILGKFKVLEMEEYFEILDSALKIIPKNIVIHRVTGDPPKNLLIAPAWVTNKKIVLNKLKKLQEQ